jgi:hypothetical protein
MPFKQRANYFSRLLKNKIWKLFFLGQFIMSLSIFLKGRVKRIPTNDNKKAWSFLKIKNKSYISPDAIIVAIYL